MGLKENTGEAQARRPGTGVASVGGLGLGLQVCWVPRAGVMGGGDVRLNVAQRPPVPLLVGSLEGPGMDWHLQKLTGQKDGMVRSCHPTPVWIFSKIPWILS